MQFDTTRAPQASRLPSPPPPGAQPPMPASHWWLRPRVPSSFATDAPRWPQPSWPLVLLVAAMVVFVNGCAVPEQIETSSDAGRAAAASDQSLATMKTYQYISIDADQTGLSNVADDGRYTYLAFAGGVPANLALFNADGEPLDALVRQGRIVAVNGIHSGGILVRVSADAGARPGHSFIAPNPRAQASDRPGLEIDPELIEARSRLENLTLQGPAFRRAIERAEARQRDRRGGGVGPGYWPSSPSSPSSSLVPVPSAGATPITPAASRLSTTGDSDGMQYQRQASGNVIRVFFASGGQAMIRPGDGLARLEAEALDADEIHIAGFTDNVGSEAQNASVARARAEAIQTLLIKRGVPPGRIFVTWHGTGRYLAGNDTEQGRAANRRAEITLVPNGRGGQNRERYSSR